MRSLQPLPFILSLLLCGAAACQRRAATRAAEAAPAAAEPAAARPAAAQQPGAAPAERIGGARARTVIEEYSDFQCPYCAAHELQHGAAMQSWLARQRGTVRFEYYDVALPYHATAATAAHAARCAGEQRRYAQAKHALFAAQREWSSASNAAQRVVQIARATVTDTAAFDRCMAADVTTLYGILAANLARGRALGIPGTPTFVIRAGDRTAQVVDPVSPDSLEKVIRALEPAR